MLQNEKRYYSFGPKGLNAPCQIKRKLHFWSTRIKHTIFFISDGKGPHTRCTVYQTGNDSRRSLRLNFLPMSCQSLPSLTENHNVETNFVVHAWIAIITIIIIIIVHMDCHAIVPVASVVGSILSPWLVLDRLGKGIHPGYW